MQERIKTGHQEFTEALNLLKTGNIEKAEVLLQQLLKSGVRDVQVYSALGDCARNQRRYADAERWYKQAVDSKPDNFAAQCNYGSVLRELRYLSDAEVHFRKALTINPMSAVASLNLGLVLLDRNDSGNAADFFSKAIGIDPQQIVFHVYYIKSLLQNKNVHQALLAQEAMLARFPDSVPSYVALGNLYMEIHETARAREFYVKALHLNPSCSEAHYNLGTIMRAWNKLDEAILCFRNAIKIEQSNVLAHVNLGEVFQVMGEHDKALQYFSDALILDPHCKIASDNMLVSMVYDPVFSTKEVHDAHVRWGLTVESAIKPREIACDKKKFTTKVRIGYISADFCNHPVAAFLEPVIANHNRDRFELFCFNQKRYVDERTSRFKQLADTWTEIASCSDRDVAEQIDKHRIDILVDCTGHMAGNRLGVFAYRPAKLQLSGFGYPSTTGLTTIDYRITDDIADPPSEAPLYSEKLLRLKNGFFCFQAPSGAPEINKLPFEQNQYMTFGSMHTTARLNRDVISLWAGVLRTVKNARMILFRTTLTSSIVKRLSRWFEEEGVNPDIIDFRLNATPGNYLSVYNEIDCLLDTIPWNGHTTACESLWMGVPVITLRGDRFSGRMVSSLLTQLGLTHFIASTPDEFTYIAHRLQDDLPLLQQIRSSLRKQMLDSKICQTSAWVLAYEEALIELLKQTCTT